MGIAQKLYEQGLITYMRTDSVALAAAAQEQIIGVVEKTYGTTYVQAQRYKTKSKNAQEAHEAIRPTDAAVADAGGADDQRRLYHLIRQRTLASQMAPARLLKTKITARAHDAAGRATTPDFSVNGSRTLFDGWLAADPRARVEDTELPAIETGEPLTLTDISDEQKQTQPPGRYSEAGLVKELERRGIGRPSTYASIIKTLYDRGYVEREARSLRPTDTGDVVSSFLEDQFASYISDSFTAEMEDELDEIAEGRREYTSTLRDFYTPFAADIAARQNTPKITTLGDAPPGNACPVCGSTMIIKLGRSGKFLSCSRWPECNGMRGMDGAIRESPRETGESCPECGEGKLIERDGKYGKFIACNRYPKCKYIKKDENSQNNDGQTGVACPVCKTGQMVGRRGRFGVFYSCSNYPACKYAIKARPTGAVCPLCNSLMMEGTKTIPERCSNKECPNHNPHKTKS
jgi:DNA topoisomerase-1